MRREGRRVCSELRVDVKIGPSVLLLEGLGFCGLAEV